MIDIINKKYPVNSLDKIVSFVKKNYGKAYTTTELSRELGMPRSTISSILQDYSVNHIIHGRSKHYCSPETFKRYKQIENKGESK